MKRVALQPAFVLHTRPFRDSSLLVELFTKDHGRICAIARGVRKAKNRGLFLPFVPLLVSWSGRSDLVSLSRVEPTTSGLSLHGHGLLAGIYVNELLVKLLHRNDPCSALYDDYVQVLGALQSNNLQAGLRIFEKRLLFKIGYGLELTRTIDGATVVSDSYYRYEIEHGFIRCDNSNGADNLISGKSMLALESEQLFDATVLSEAKVLMRRLLNFLLRDKPIRSRELF